jgi:hypothetical protein
MGKTESEPILIKLDYQKLFDQAVKMSHLTPRDGVFTYQLTGQANYLEETTPAAIVALYWDRNIKKLEFDTLLLTCDETNYPNNAQIFNLIPQTPRFVPQPENAEFDLKTAQDIGRKLNQKKMPTLMLVFHDDGDGGKRAITLHTTKGMPPETAYEIVNECLELQYQRHLQVDKRTKRNNIFDLVETYSQKIQEALPEKIQQMIDFSQNYDDGIGHFMIDGPEHQLSIDPQFTINIIAGIFVIQTGEGLIYCPCVKDFNSVNPPRQLDEFNYGLQSSIPGAGEINLNTNSNFLKREIACAQDGSPICVITVGHSNNTENQKPQVILSTVNELPPSSAIELIKTELASQMDDCNQN